MLIDLRFKKDLNELYKKYEFGDGGIYVENTEETSVLSVMRIDKGIYTCKSEHQFDWALKFTDYERVDRKSTRTEYRIVKRNSDASSRDMIFETLEDARAKYASLFQPDYKIVKSTTGADQAFIEREKLYGYYPFNGASDNIKQVLKNNPVFDTSARRYVLFVWLVRKNNDEVFISHSNNSGSLLRWWEDMSYCPDPTGGKGGLPYSGKLQNPKEILLWEFIEVRIQETGVETDAAF